MHRHWTGNNRQVGRYGVIQQLGGLCRTYPVVGRISNSKYNECCHRDFRGYTQEDPRARVYLRAARFVTEVESSGSLLSTIFGSKEERDSLMGKHAKISICTTSSRWRCVASREGENSGDARE